jgi:FemAB-related protein (PEP-CTERM system-associated)
MVTAAAVPIGGGAAGLNVRTHASGHDPAVERFVASHPAASAYHSPVWLHVIARSFGHATRYLVAETPRGVAGVLPIVFFSSRLFGRFAVSLPFVNYGGVLADTPEAGNALLDAAIDETVAAGGSHLELRHSVRTFRALEARHHKVAMRLDLKRTVDAQWQALDRKVRNQVRKAEKSGLDVRAGGAELLRGFYEVFAHNMRDLGTPVYGIRFFEEVLGALPGATRVFVVSHRSRPVAAALTHWHGHTVEVPWASSRRDFNPLCANVLLYWEMLRFAVERGFGLFDFGRSTPNEGTFHFKRQWGAEPAQLVWEYWTAGGRAVPELNPHNPKFALAIRAWQRLPVRVATAVGPLIVRSIP